MPPLFSFYLIGQAGVISFQAYASLKPTFCGNAAKILNNRLFFKPVVASLSLADHPPLEPKGRGAW